MTLCGIDEITTQLNYTSSPPARVQARRYFFYLPKKKSLETCVNNVDNVIICVFPRHHAVKIIKQFFCRREGNQNRHKTS